MAGTEEISSPKVRNPPPSPELPLGKFVPAPDGTDRRAHRGDQPRLGGGISVDAPFPGSGNLSAREGVVNGAYFQVGGGMKQKLATDGTGVLYNYIRKHDFDWVAFAEHQLKNTGSLPKLPGYFCVAKSAKQNVGGVCFYIKQKFKFLVTKPKQRSPHHILWIKFPSKNKSSLPLFLAVTYCRTDSHPEEVNAFYAELAHATLQFQAFGNVLVVGDFNARLGKLTGDKKPAGAWAKNKNAPFFEAFIEATQMKLLNQAFAYGRPTFVRPSQRATSIIDLGCCSSDLEVGMFRVEPLDTGHYLAHNTVIRISHPISSPTQKPPPPPLFFYEHLSEKNEKRFFEKVLEELDGYVVSDPGHALLKLSTVFERAREMLKKQIRQISGIKSIPRLQNLQRELERWNKKAIALRHLPADSPQVDYVVGCYNRIRAEFLRVEKAVTSSFFEKQLQTLDRMDFIHRTKFFWKMVAGLRSSRGAGDPCTISSSRDEFCDNWVDFYQRLYCPTPIPSKLRKRAERVNAVRARFVGRDSSAAELDSAISLEELRGALRAQRKDAAPGIDNISPSMLSRGPEKLQLFIYTVLKNAFENESGFASLKTILIKANIKGPQWRLARPG